MRRFARPALGDQLEEKIRNLETALQEARVDRDRLDQDAQTGRDRLEAARIECKRLSEQLHERDEALMSVHAKHEEIAQQLRVRDDELRGKQAEFERLAKQLDVALNDVKPLVTSMTRREQEARLESQQLHARIDELHRTLDQAVKNHLHERAQLAEQLRMTREQLASEAPQRTALLARISDLQAALQKLPVDRGPGPGVEIPRLGAELPPLAEGKRSLHKEVNADIPASLLEKPLPADRLGASIMELAQSLVAPDPEELRAQAQAAADENLKAARAENEVLRKKVAQLEQTRQKLSSMLGDIGITVYGPGQRP